MCCEPTSPFVPGGGGPALVSGLKRAVCVFSTRVWGEPGPCTQAATRCTRTPGHMPQVPTLSSHCMRPPHTPLSHAPRTRLRTGPLCRLVLAAVCFPPCLSPTPIGATLPRVSGRPGEPGGSLGRGGAGSVPKTAQAMGSFRLLRWVVGGRLCGVGEAGLTPPGCSPVDIEAEARAAPCGARVS